MVVWCLHLVRLLVFLWVGFYCLWFAAGGLLVDLWFVILIFIVCVCWLAGLPMVVDVLRFRRLD